MEKETSVVRLGLLALILSLIMAACAPVATPTQQPQAEVVVEQVVVTATPLPAEPEKPLRIALAMTGTITDAAFAQTMYENLLAVQEELGEDKIEIAYSENLFKATDAAAAIRDYASQGYDIVIAHSATFGAAVKQIAPEFPEVSFAWGPQTDTLQAAGINNVFAYRAKVEEGGYVLGTMAANMTEAGVIGVCGPVEASDAKFFIDSFKAAALATRPDVKVNVIYTGSFTDYALSAAAAEAHIAEGADILTGIAAAMPCMTAAKEKGLKYFAVQGDWTALEPDTVVASVVYDWRNILKDMIATRKAGVLGGKVYYLSLENGGLQISYSPSIDIPAEVKAAADDAQKGIADGTIKLQLTP